MPHIAILLLIGVSPIVSLCHGIVGHKFRSVLRIVDMFSEVVSMLRWLEFVGAGDGGGEGFESMT